MKTLTITIFILSISLTACGQDNTRDDSQKSFNNTNTKTDNMDLSKITNETVRNAIEALQNNNLQQWYSFFTDDATFTDDGRILSFKSFFNNAFDKKEKFLSIDKVENEGKSITGNFYAGQWGTFRVYFKFHLNSAGKIDRLDIGQI